MRHAIAWAAAFLCTATSLFTTDTATATQIAARRSADERLTIKSGRIPIYAFAPSTETPAARPLSIYLHGMCGDPSHGCEYLRGSAARNTWLLCPSAPSACSGGGASWSGSTADRAAIIERAEQRLLAEHPGAVDASQPRVLIGFSQGAYVARDILRLSPGRYRGVLFIGADVQPTADALRTAGVRRAVFASGQFDRMRRPLEKAAAALVSSGYPARFVDLGPVGHTYVASRDQQVLRDAVTWLEEDDD